MNNRNGAANTAPQSLDSLLTVRDTAALLRVGPTKTWGLIAEGKLEVVRLSSRCTRVKRSSVERLMNGVAQ